MQGAWRGVGALASLLSVAACSALIGIEEVHEGPVPGSEGGTSGKADAGSNPNGGSEQGGTAHAGTSSGGTSNAGTSNAGTSNGGTSNGGTDTAGAAGMGDEAGAGGALPGGSPVHGHVIDFWGHFLAKVPVEIGGKQTVTDAQGAFSFDDVPDAYDVSLVAEYEFFVTQRLAVVYQGLTRRDPTLQVVRGSEQLSANFDTNYTGTTQSVTGTRSFTLAMAGPDGVYEKLQPPSGGSYGLQANWLGPATTVEIAHGLVWQNGNSGVPEGYYAYGTASVALLSTTTDHSMVNLDLTPKSITSSTLSGSVTPAGFSDRLNSISMRFTSGATIKLASVTPTVSNFSYLVPTLPNASVTFAAAEGCTNIQVNGCAILHQDGLVGGGGALAVSIPQPATSLTIAPAAAVTESTLFSFTPGNAASSAYVSVFANKQSQNDHLYLITTQHSFKLPKVLNGGYELLSGESYGWRVEAHGAPAAVDDLAGPTGYMDAFSVSPADLQPRGARAGNGSYTSSAEKVLTIAP